MYKNFRIQINFFLELLINKFNNFFYNSEIFNFLRANAFTVSSSDNCQPLVSIRLVYCLLYKNGITNWKIFNVKIEKTK